MFAIPRFPRRWLAGLALAVAGALAHAADTWPLPPAGSTLVGETRIEYAKQEDTFIDIAQRNGLGYDEIVAANPGVDRWLPGEGTPVILPLEHILPDAPREGIVVNLPEMRLYYFPRGQNVVKSYAISIGRMDWHSPLGRTYVTTKVVNPTWTPPASIKAEHLEKGDPLPDVVPGGPDNPLGTRAMRLGLPGYLIHGTNNPNGIGMRVTHGCIRMYPDDIERLFPEVPVKTPVTLVNQTAKLGWKNGVLYLEYHSPLEEDEIPTQQQIDETVALIHSKIGDQVPLIAPDIVQTVVRQASGMPVAISTGPTIDPAELPPPASTPIPIPIPIPIPATGAPLPPAAVPGSGAPVPVAPPALPPAAPAPTRAAPSTPAASVQALAPAAGRTYPAPAPAPAKPTTGAAAPKPAAVAAPAAVVRTPIVGLKGPVVVAQAPSTPSKAPATKTATPARPAPTTGKAPATPARAPTAAGKPPVAVVAKTPAKTAPAHVIPVKPASKPATVKDAHAKDTPAKDATRAATAQR